LIVVDNKPHHKKWGFLKSKNMEKLDPIQKVNKMIEEIIENFDFDKCHRAMEVLNWKWVVVGVPTVEIIKERAKRRLDDVVEMINDKTEKKRSGVDYFVSSGGLKATGWINRYGQIEALRLEFILTDWDSDAD
jgi:hypothetical protein